jgi:hypothetical protein
MTDQAPLSESSREYRVAMRAVLGISVLAVFMSIASLRGMISPLLGRLAAVAAVSGIFYSIWLGLKSHRQALADREKESRRVMIVMLAAQLGKYDDAKLEELAAKRGPAGEAAKWILQGRREKRAKPG